MLVLHARGSELERAFPFGVVRQLFERAAGDERHFTGAAGLAKPIFDLAEEAEESSYARLHGLYWLCANLAAEQPLVVCVDDAQWADEPSLNFLGFLLRRLEDLPIALLVGTRPRAEQESESLRAIVTDPATRVLRPTALSGDAVRDWVRDAVDGQAADGVLPRLPRDHRWQPVPRVRAPARGHAQAAEGHRAGGRGGARARPRSDLHGRAAAPEAAPVRRPCARAGDRHPRRGRPAAHRRAARRAGRRRPQRRRSTRSAAPTSSPATPTGSASCIRSCSRRSTTTSRSTSGPKRTTAPPACWPSTAPRRRRSPRTCRSRRRAPTRGRSRPSGRPLSARSSWVIPRSRSTACSGPWRSRRRSRHAPPS